jgi:hypothetical protein
MAAYITVAGLYITFADPYRYILQTGKGNSPQGSCGQNHRKMKNKKSWLPLFLLFIILNCFFVAGKNWLLNKGVDQGVLIGGNLVLFFATGLSFFVYQRSLNSANPQASVRGMYGSFMVKFFLCLIAAFIYIIAAKKNLNKPALIICMGLYIVYTVIEVTVLQKLLKQKTRDKNLNK